MNLPQLEPYEDKAIDTVASVINGAKNKLGYHQTLGQLINTRAELAATSFLSLNNLLSNPVIINGEMAIIRAIEKSWKLTDVLMYNLKFLSSSNDDIADYHYFEAVFSQPTQQYPIPQATASVFFIIQEKHLENTGMCGLPALSFRVEGHHQDHNVRFVKLSADWILGVLQMKLKLYQRIEEMNIF